MCAARWCWPRRRRSLTLVTVAGNLSPVDLLHLRGHFGIPRLDADDFKNAPVAVDSDPTRRLRELVTDLDRRFCVLCAMRRHCHP